MENKMQVNNSFKTAIRRNKPSSPCVWLVKSGLINPDDKVLDYGCGKGDDVRGLANIGIDVTGYDPHYAPQEAPFKHYDVVMCNYVLNVLDDDDQVYDCIAKATSHAKDNGKVYFTVRRDLKKQKVVNHNRKTVQRNVELDGRQFVSVHSCAGYEIYTWRDDV